MSSGKCVKSGEMKTLGVILNQTLPDCFQGLEDDMCWTGLLWEKSIQLVNFESSLRHGHHATNKTIHQRLDCQRKRAHIFDFNYRLRSEHANKDMKRFAPHRN